MNLGELSLARHDDLKRMSSNLKGAEITTRVWSSFHQLNIPDSRHKPRSKWFNCHLAVAAESPEEKTRISYIALSDSSIIKVYNTRLT